MAPRSVPRYETVDIPAKFMELAQRRTQYLFQVMTWGDKPMRIVLASAYLQGINDAADAMDSKTKREEITPPMPLAWHC